MRSVAEWLIALGVLGGAAWVGAPLVLQWIPQMSSSVTLVESALPALPVGVPPGAESVPFLMLLDGAEIRLGMAESDLRDSRVSRWSVGPAITEPGVIDERLVLPYRADSTRFWVVLDRTEMGKERQVTGIYLP
jgi:hypothetical protein